MTDTESDVSTEVAALKALASDHVRAGECFTLAPWPRIAIVAGETSGDHLGAALMAALRRAYPNAQFVGIAGPAMRTLGCEAWYRAESLAVMGLSEVIPHLRRLLHIRRDLVARLLVERPDIYIGVDYKEFNLSVERALKAAGICTVQYVSPQVWAWRQGRVKSIARSVDLMLCLLPFEKPFYEGKQVQAAFVGHPLADEIPEQIDQMGARRMLGLSDTGSCIAVLPGSRESEVQRLAAPFAATVAWLKTRYPDMQFVAPMANVKAREIFVQALVQAGVAESVQVIDAQSQRAIAASNVVLLASGTATLEAALIKRPMVVAYRLSWFTTWVLKLFRLIKTPYIAQPNLLCGRKVVPEFVNADVRAEVLGPAVVSQLERPDREQLVAEFSRLHLQLRQNASETSAQAIVALLAARTARPDGPTLREMR